MQNFVNFLQREGVVSRKNPTRRKMILDKLKEFLFSSNPNRLFPADLKSFRQAKLLFSNNEAEQVAHSFWRRLETEGKSDRKNARSVGNAPQLPELAQDLKDAGNELEFILSKEFNANCRGPSSKNGWLSSRGLSSKYCNELFVATKRLLMERLAQ